MAQIDRPQIFSKDEFEMEANRIGPLPQDLKGQTELDHLKLWLARVYPASREAERKGLKTGVMRHEYWSGRVAGTNQPCRGELTYVDGPSYHPTLDLLLFVPQPDAALTFRSTILFTDKQTATFYMPEPFQIDRWLHLVPELNSEVFVSQKAVVLRSRPMIDGLEESFLSIRHELTIQFGPVQNPIVMIGKDLASGRSLSCEFAPKI